MKHYRDFLGSPVVKNPVPPLKGAWVRSMVGDLISCILCSQKKEKLWPLLRSSSYRERNQSWLNIYSGSTCLAAWPARCNHRGRGGSQPDGKKKKQKNRPTGYWEHSWPFCCNDFLSLSVILQLWKCRCKTGKQDKAEMLLIVVAQALESESWV